MTRERQKKTKKQGRCVKTGISEDFSAMVDPLTGVPRENGHQRYRQNTKGGREFHGLAVEGKKEAS